VAGVSGLQFQVVICTLKDLDKVWLVTFLPTVSDLNTTEILTMSENDSKAPHKLLSHGGQLSMDLKLPPAFQVIAFAEMFFRQLLTDQGSLLSHFKRNGGIKEDGSINWRIWGYTMKLSDDEKFIAELSHRTLPNKKVNVTIFMIPTTVDISLPWLDARAAFVQPPRKPVRVADFWGKKEGPNAMKSYITESEEFDVLVNSVWKKYSDSVENDMSATRDLGIKVHETLEQQAAKRKEEAMSRARASAAAAMQRKKEVTVMPLSTTFTITKNS